ncbi:glycoside hydrolase [Kalaharituber pfeilii]|nr:glycoside hydrolase [Kalaharituber pfeilii]
MKISILFATLATAALVSAHGHITQITIGGKTFPGNNPYAMFSGNKNPRRIVWDYKDNGPIGSKELQSANIACSRNAKPVESFGKAKAGDEVVFTWSKWSESHRGPTMTYLARIPDGASVTGIDPTTLTFHKIHELGLISSEGPKGRWASDLMRESDNTVRLKIPASVPSGKYVLRHELLALHQAQKGNAQFYPVCANLEIIGASGGELGGEGVKFPGAYKASDPGVDINIHAKALTSYVCFEPPRKKK